MAVGQLLCGAPSDRCRALVPRKASPPRLTATNAPPPPAWEQPQGYRMYLAAFLPHYRPRGAVTPGRQVQLRGLHKRHTSRHRALHTVHSTSQHTVHSARAWRKVRGARLAHGADRPAPQRNGHSMGRPVRRPPSTSRPPRVPNAVTLVSPGGTSTPSARHGRESSEETYSLPARPSLPPFTTGGGCPQREGGGGQKSKIGPSTRPLDACT